MPTPAEVIRSLVTFPEYRDLPWWKRAAIEAVAAGHYIVIPGRQDSDAYLARYWLTPPKKDEDGYSSAESIVLHQFIRGDDDGALHNHPYDFVTTILSGGYDEVTGELVNGGVWLSEQGRPRSVVWVGPAEKDWKTTPRRAGDQVRKEARQVHMATNPLPDTWTLVQTGVRCNDWGFYPPGKPFVPWRQFVQHTTVVGGKS
jgi:hypothetical protein